MKKYVVMKTVLKTLLSIVIASIFIYTIYFLYQKSQAEPVVYETTTPVVQNIISRHETLIK